MKESYFNLAGLDQDKLDILDAFIDSVEDKKGDVIAILHRAQKIFGYLSKDLQLYISRSVDLPVSKINGIVSFYSFFNEEEKGKYNVSVCMGTACFVKDAGLILKEFETVLGLDKEKTTTDDRLFSISDVRCIGACGLAPVVTINGKIYGHVKKDDVKDIIKSYRDKEVAND